MGRRAGRTGRVGRPFLAAGVIRTFASGDWGTRRLRRSPSVDRFVVRVTDWLGRSAILALSCLAVILCVAITPGALGGQSAARPAARSYVERDSVRVVYWGDQREAATRTLEAAHDPIPLPGISGAALLPRATVYLPPDRLTFDSLASGVPAWAAGVAIPSTLTIVIPPGRGNVGAGDPRVTLRHEIVHLAVHRHLGDRVPRWFDEGYATWVSGGWDESTGWLIRLALLRGTAPPLDSLTLGWPRGEARARLAYLLSASAVRHLATSRGEPAFAAFIAEWRRVGSMETAMRSVYQMSLFQFEREWRGMVRRRYGWMLAISQIGAFWGVVAILVFLLGTLRRRRNREKLAELRREEYMLPASTPDTYDGVDPAYPPD